MQYWNCTGVWNSSSIKTMTRLSCMTNTKSDDEVVTQHQVRFICNSSFFSSQISYAIFVNFSAYITWYLVIIKTNIYSLSPFRNTEPCRPWLSYVKWLHLIYHCYGLKFKGQGSMYASGISFNISPHNVFSPVDHRAITATSSRLIPIGPLWTYLLNFESKYKTVHWIVELLSGKSQPFH